MIALLCGLAWADPIALRAPQARVVAVAGLPDTSAGVWLTPALGVSAEYHPPGALGLSVGTRWDVARTQGGFGLELAAAGGPMWAVLDPGLVLAVTPTAQVGWADRKVDAELGLAVPAVVRVAPDAAARFPVLGELWLGGALGPVRLGGHFGAGPMFVLDGPTELGWQFGVHVGVGRLPDAAP